MDRDKTGPEGKGPKTGRQWGICKGAEKDTKEDNDRPLGRGLGKGLGRRPRR